MFSVKCRCGKSEKTFQNDVGPFFIAECCEEAGYDHMGVMTKSDEETTEPPADTTAVAAGDKVSVEITYTGVTVSPTGIEATPTGIADLADLAKLPEPMDLENMSWVELKAECDRRGIKYKKSESKASLAAMIRAGAAIAG